jgi:pimeloyl-ACP methyl ester carboxylesterase
MLTHGPLEFSCCASGLAENPAGPVVLCLHGFPDHARSFRFQLPLFAGSGYRAIAPTLRGYEPSSQPADGDYSLAALASDVIAWIDELGEQRVHLIGHDWGAVIAYLAAAHASERFHSLSTLAIPHAARLIEGIRRVPGQLAKSWYMAFLQLPGLSDWAVEYNDWALVRRLWKHWSPGFDLPAEEWTSLRETFEAPGVKGAMLQYYRQNASPAVILGWKKNAASRHTVVPVRTLAITGADDGCMDTRLHDHVFRAEDFPRGVRVQRVEGAGHFLHQEKPDAVNQLLLEWLQEGESEK